MNEKEKRELNIKDFKYSFNTYNKIYNLEILEHGNWRRLVLDKKAFDRAIKLKFRTNENTRNNPYNPYFWFRIKWSIKIFLSFLDKHVNRINWFKKNLAFWSNIIAPIIAIYIALISVKDAQKARQQTLKQTEYITTLETLVKREKEVLTEKILMLTKKIDSVHLNHLENIRVLEKKIEKKK
jgi:hypothetical protein